MSVLIKEMEMPKSCSECRFFVDAWCYAFNAEDWRNAYNKPPDGERLKDCPLEEPKTGEWIKVIDEETPNTVKWHYECDQCGAGRFEKDQQYCSRCGARMLGEDGEA